MYLLSTQEHAIPLCVKILQILFQLELSWFWIEGNVRFWDFLTFYVPLCSKKLSVHCAKSMLQRPKKWTLRQMCRLKRHNRNFVTMRKYDLIQQICCFELTFKHD